MKHTFRIIHEASAEFTDAVVWYEERRTGLGAEFFDAVSAIIGLIGEEPELGAAISSMPSHRRRLVSRFPYEVVYRVTTSEVTIVAIAHLRRRPGYWVRRS